MGRSVYLHGKGFKATIQRISNIIISGLGFWPKLSKRTRPPEEPSSRTGMLTGEVRLYSSVAPGSAELNFFSDISIFFLALQCSLLVLKNYLPSSCGSLAGLG